MPFAIIGQSPKRRNPGISPSAAAAAAALQRRAARAGAERPRADRSANSSGNTPSHRKRLALQIADSETSTTPAIAGSASPGAPSLPRQRRSERSSAHGVATNSAQTISQESGLGGRLRNRPVEESGRAPFDRSRVPARSISAAGAQDLPPETGAGGIGQLASSPSAIASSRRPARARSAARATSPRSGAASSSAPPAARQQGGPQREAGMQIRPDTDSSGAREHARPRRQCGIREQRALEQQRPGDAQQLRTQLHQAIGGRAQRTRPQRRSPRAPSDLLRGPPATPVRGSRRPAPRGHRAAPGSRRACTARGAAGPRARTPSAARPPR